jgi:predicted nucleic acid-binding protein
MKVMLDTNIILDVLLDRLPFSIEAVEIFSAIEALQFQGFISATTVTTIFYLASKTLGRASAKRALKKLLQLFEVAPINQSILQRAIETSFADFEDAVLYQAALQAGASSIVTRNPKDFKQASLPIYTPTEFLRSFAS